MKMKKLLMPLLFVLLSGPAQMRAQDAMTTQDEAMRRMQAKMDELRAQMAQLQAEIDAMHGVNNLANAVNDIKPVPQSVQTGAIERTMPPLPPAVALSPEQQHMAVGKETAAYESFAEESEPVPRLYNAPLEANMPGFFVLPGTQTMMRINGLIKTDVMFDPRPAGLADSFIPSTIPIPQTTSTNNFNASIRESRFSADLRIPVSNIGMARTFIQFDFFVGNGATTPRLRHFYAQLHNVLVGQTNTVFMDPDAWPDIIEFQGPTSGLLARIPQVRYSFPLGKGFSGAVSVEQPSSDISFSVNGSSAVPITPAPNGGLRVRYEGERGHLYFSSILRELAVHMPVTGQQQSVFGWGLNLSSTWRVVGRDTLNYQVAYGNGCATQIGSGPYAESTANLRSMGQLSAQLDQIRPVECDLWIVADSEYCVPARHHISQEHLFVSQCHLECVWQLVFRCGVYVRVGGAEEPGEGQCAPSSVFWEIYLREAASERISAAARRYIDNRLLRFP